MALAKVHRRRGGEGRRQDLVLPDSRLCLRRFAARPTPPPSSRPTAAPWSARCKPSADAVSDFSSFLLQAQASKAQILGLANAGGDFTNAIKAAKEFGVNKTMKLAGLLVFINDVHSLGLANTEGLQVADSWYWNQDDASRKFAEALLRQVQAHALQPAGRRLLGHARPT